MIGIRYIEDFVSKKWNVGYRLWPDSFKAQYDGEHWTVSISMEAGSVGPESGLKKVDSSATNTDFDAAVLVLLEKVRKGLC